MKSFPFPFIFWLLLFTKILLFLDKSTYIIIHNHFKSRKPKTTILVIDNRKAYELDIIFRICVRFSRKQILFTKTLSFLDKSTYIIIHNHLKAENQRQVYSSLTIGRQKDSISFFVFAYVLVEKQIINHADG